VLGRCETGTEELDELYSLEDCCEVTSTKLSFCVRRKGPYNQEMSDLSVSLNFENACLDESNSGKLGE
jgi:hypothetical protein